MLATTMYFIGAFMGFIAYPMCRVAWKEWIKEYENDTDREIN